MTSILIINERSGNFTITDALPYKIDSKYIPDEIFIRSIQETANKLKKSIKIIK